MRKFFKFFLVLICLFFVTIPSVYGVDINMNIDNTVNSTNTVTNDVSNTLENTVLNNNSSAKISTTDTSEDFTLNVSDIINIILIAVGIVLILLAIAILLKIK